MFPIVVSIFAIVYQFKLLPCVPGSAFWCLIYKFFTILDCLVHNFVCIGPMSMRPQGGENQGMSTMGELHLFTTFNKCLETSIPIVYAAEIVSTNIHLVWSVIAKAHCHMLPITNMVAHQEAFSEASTPFGTTNAHVFTTVVWVEGPIDKVPVCRTTTRKLSPQSVNWHNAWILSMEESNCRWWRLDSSLRFEEIRFGASFQIINVWVLLDSGKKWDSKEELLNSDHSHMPQEESNWWGFVGFPFS